MGRNLPRIETGRLRVLVLHNRDFDSAGEESAPHLVASKDVLYAARDVAAALSSRGHRVEVAGVSGEDLGPLLKRLGARPPDVVFNLCESLAGDECNEVVVPALLDMLRVPYTGSGPFSLALSLRKERAKEVLKACQVPTPAYAVLPGTGGAAEADLALIRERGLCYPIIVKPARQDASVGISASSVVSDEDALVLQVAALRAQWHHSILIEEYIDGRELSVSFLGNFPPDLLPLGEIDFSLLPQGRPRIVCYEAKWNRSSAEYVGTRPMPAAELQPHVRERIAQVARSLFSALELCDYGRCDIRLTPDGIPFVIDVNPNCDLSEHAGFALAARRAGLCYDELIEQIALCALQRNQHAASRRRATTKVFAEARADGGSNGAHGARGEGRALFGGRGSLRARAHRQRAL